MFLQKGYTNSLKSIELKYGQCNILVFKHQLLKKISNILCILFILQLYKMVVRKKFGNDTFFKIVITFTNT